MIFLICNHIMQVGWCICSDFKKSPIFLLLYTFIATFLNPYLLSRMIDETIIKILDQVINIVLGRFLITQGYVQSFFTHL